MVAPDAALKIYLSADPAARAKRRAAELSPDQPRDVSAVEKALVARDSYDSSRVTAPLSAAEDAVRLDSTDMTLEQVIAHIVELAKARTSPV